MKRNLVLTLILLGSCLSLAGQSITVTSPAAGNTWGIGGIYTIAWTSAGVTGPLSIRLRLADQPTAEAVLVIAASAAESGSLSWTIPGSVSPGSYKIRVRTTAMNPAIAGDSGIFQIAPALPPPPPPPPPASLAMLDPSFGPDQVLGLGSDQLLRWKAVSVPGKVRLELVYHQGQMLGIIAEDLPAASGGYNWKAGKYGDGKYAPTDGGHLYHVRIRSQSDPSLWSESNPPFGLTFKRTLVKNLNRWLKPDLVGCAESIVVTPLNVPGTVHFYVKNIGRGTAKAPFKVLFSIVAHCNKTVTLNADLAPGETRFVGECSAQGAGVAQYKTYVQADCDGQVDESSEVNNRFEGGFSCRNQEQGSVGPVACSGESQGQ